MTGANGNVGLHLRKYLSGNGVIKVVERKNFNPGYITNLILKAEGEVYFIHLAWPVRGLDFRTSEDNISFLKKTLEVFNSIKGLPVNIIGAGSASEAGNCRIIEDRIKPNPQNLYAETKYKLSEFLSKEFPKQYIWVRPASQVSFYDPPHRLIGTILSSRDKSMTLYGADNNIDLIHVSDVAQAFYQCVLKFHSLPTEVVVGTGRTILVSKFAELFNKPNLIFKNYQEPISINTNPVALKESGWNPKYISANQLYGAIMNESHSANSQKCSD
jgi:nucleoside-diphosphate-sugar epimerase